MTIMRNRIELLLVVLSTTFFVGCNSLDYHANGEESRVYPATRGDAVGLAEAHSTGMYAPWIFGYSAIDMPFSFVVDTLCLPSDIYDVEHHKYQQHHPTVETNSVANQIQTNVDWVPTMSPKQLQQWKTLPGPN
jgi:uncharacterized protein YceK